jgi:hypothetical protein
MWANCETLPRPLSLLLICRANNNRVADLLADLEAQLENENLISNALAADAERNPQSTEPYLRGATFAQQFRRDCPYLLIS